MYIFVFICVYVCMYMYMYICIYMYVNTHTTQTLPTQEAFKKEMRGERAAWSLPKGTAVTARLEPSRAADALNLVLSTSHDTFLRAALVFGERVFAGAGVCAIYIYIYIAPGPLYLARHILAGRPGLWRAHICGRRCVYICM